MIYFCLPFFFTVLFIVSAIIFLVIKGRCIGYSPDTLQERLDIKSNITIRQKLKHMLVVYGEAPEWKS